jgi:hypothetical protein
MPFPWRAGREGTRVGILPSAPSVDNGRQEQPPEISQDPLLPGELEGIRASAGGASV